jgi:hypothetical protein
MQNMASSAALSQDHFEYFKKELIELKTRMGDNNTALRN